MHATYWQCLYIFASFFLQTNATKVLLHDAHVSSLHALAIQILKKGYATYQFQNITHHLEENQRNALQLLAL